MTQSSRQLWVSLTFVFLGLFGAGLAVSGVLVALPAPAAGGTCGPGTASEAPIVALFDPVSIGAGPEPAATDTAGRAQWDAFVSECQTSADDRGLAALAILVVSLFVAVVGPMVWRRSHRSPGTSLQPMIEPMEHDWRL